MSTEYSEVEEGRVARAESRKVLCIYISYLGSYHTVPYSVIISKYLLYCSRSLALIASRSGLSFLVESVQCAEHKVKESCRSCRYEPMTEIFGLDF